MVYKDVTVIGIPCDDEISIEIINKKNSDSFREYFEAFWKFSKTFN